MAGKPKTFSVEARDNVAALLDALEPKPTKARGLSSADVVDSLKAKIKEAQAKGFSLEEILKMFEDGGISIGMTTLKTAMKRPRKPAKKEATQPELKTDTKPEITKQEPPKKLADPEQRKAMRAEIETTLTPAAQKRGER